MVIGAIVVTVLTLHTVRNTENSYLGRMETKSASTIGIDLPPKLLDSVLEAHEQMLQRLREDYGDEHFEKIFRRHGDESKSESEPEPDQLAPEEKLQYRPIRPFGPEDVQYNGRWNAEEKELYRAKTEPQNFHSAANFRRKMIIKILRAHSRSYSTPSNAGTFVWATGGHSAAAGHGNLFRESYTKVMEAAVSGVFAASGLELEARNYAMSATSSASEMSMCFPQIYGDDVDIFSWDFGMLEARDYLSGRLLHYATRGFLSNTRLVPAFVALQGINRARKQMLEELHDSFRGTLGNETNNGLALFLNDEDYWTSMKEAIPDVRVIICSSLC